LIETHLESKYRFFINHSQWIHFQKFGPLSNFSLNWKNILQWQKQKIRAQLQFSDLEKRKNPWTFQNSRIIFRLFILLIFVPKSLILLTPVEFLASSLKNNWEKVTSHLALPLYLKKTSDHYNYYFSKMKNKFHFSYITILKILRQRKSHRNFLWRRI
jgi:hypothetical protein